MSAITPPSNIIECVTHSNPYPFYSDLLSERPLYFDKELGTWVASSADMINTVFTHPNFAVRPTSKPVPDHLIGSTAGTIFHHLIRMNEGENHTRTKAIIAKEITRLPLYQVLPISHKWAEILIETNSNNLNQFCADLPVHVVVDLLGVSPNDTSEVVELVQDFALCLNPLSNTEQANRGKKAATDLFDLIKHNLSTDFYTRIVELTLEDIAISNVIGLLFQSYEATAGLIGNALQALAVNDNLREELRTNENLVSNFVQEVSRWNPSVQNTIRYLTVDTVIDGQAMTASDSIILVLAAANRDGVVNSNPHQFLLHRENRTSFTFGVGHHACIGENIAHSIAKAALLRVLQSDLVRQIDTQLTTFKPYRNLRIPVLIQTEGKSE